MQFFALIKRWPQRAIIYIWMNLSEIVGLSPTDLVHLGYAMAYDLDYLITTDRTMREYKVPSAFKLVIKHPKNVDDIRW